MKGNIAKGIDKKFWLGPMHPDWEDEMTDKFGEPGMVSHRFDLVVGLTSLFLFIGFLALIISIFTGG